MIYKLFGVFFTLALFVTVPVFAQTAERSADETEPRACTQEAKLCPDGSYVGRTGPNCEFEACPSDTERVSALTAVGEIFISDGRRISDDGNVSSYRWRQISGPFKFDIKEGALLSVVPQTAGTYEFELAVTDSAGIVSVQQKLTLKVGDPIPDIDLSVERPPDSHADGDPIPDIDLSFRNDGLDRKSDSSLVDGAEPVIINAVEVRGWDPEKKREFLATVKTHAQIESRQDLDNFAKGVLVQDENVEAVVSSEEEVEVKYRVPAKFLGIFRTSLRVTVSVEAQGEGEAKSSVSERVKVKFPWLSIFFSIPEDVREDALQEAVLSQVSNEIETQTQFEIQAQARLFQLISNVLKVKHDTAMNSIRNVR